MYSEDRIEEIEQIAWEVSTSEYDVYFAHESSKA